MKRALWGLIALGVWGLIALVLAVAIPALAQTALKTRALDATAVTVSSTAVVAVAGPANGCNISSAVALIVDAVGTPGTSASGTSQLQPALAAPYQCGPIGAGVSIMVNCSGGGTCSWTGYRW